MGVRLVLAALAALTALGACSREAAKAPAPPANEAPAVSADPAAAIAPLYQRYMTPAASTQFPSLDQQAPWSDDLRAKLIEMMQRSDARNEPILDFDPFIGAQDYQLKSLAVTTDAVVPGSHAVVRARFINIDHDDEVLYDLIWQDNQWRVDNMRGENWDLRQVIAG